jgi:hypothetical protein
MLDITLATEFVPGTNLKGEVAGANWLFLLPSLEQKRVLCVGQVSLPSLLALARVADEVWVLADAGSQDVRAAAKKYGLGNVRLVDTLAALPEHSVSLALLAEEGARRLARDSARLADRLMPDGLVYVEQQGSRGEASRALASLGGQVQSYWLTPLGGEMHTAVPVQDQATKSYFLRNSLTSRSLNLGTLKRAVRGTQTAAPARGAGTPRTSASAARRKSLPGRAKGALRTTLASLYHSVQGALDGAEQRLSGTSLFESVASRYGLLAGVAGSNLTEQPPSYLRTIARGAGVDIEHHRWGLSARGEYSSRKVLVFLFNHAGEAPEYIVKMTRDPALNPRLENERRALAMLEERGIGDRETLPRAVFSGYHRKLFVLGETIVDGAPFERRASGDADCPHARAAIDWLTDLGQRTIHHIAPQQVAEGLEKLFRRFAEIYQLGQAERAFLEIQIAAIAGSGEPFPLVFQHGDPGTWNAMVTPSGRVAFLDWEAAEPDGLPLWDLFYFIRTYGAWSLQAAISGDVTKGFGTQFLANTALQSVLVEATARYCARVGISEQLIEPLFYTCWMHRGLKEATRLAPAQLNRGHYLNVLRASMEQRDALQSLFSLVAFV